MSLPTNIKLVKQKKRHFGPENDKIIQAEVDKLMAVGHIEEIYSQNGYPMSSWCLYLERNGECELTSETSTRHVPKDFYLLPRIDQVVDFTFGCEQLTMMEALQGYRQILLAPDDRKRVSFITSVGTFCYVAMPFRIKMQDLLTNNWWRKYFIRKLGKMLKSTWTKCFMITQRGIDANPLKIKAILDMKVSTNINEVQRMTKRVAALSHFISKAVEKSLTFFKVLRKAKNFEWDASCQQTFEELKNYRAGLPLLVKPSQGDALYLYLSATPQAVSSVVIWRGGGGWRGGGEKPLLESHLPSRRSAGAATAAAASFLVADGTSGFGFGFGVAVRVGVWGRMVMVSGGFGFGVRVGFWG
ncbi:UNVERIFIED_CONTAM: hypothetical protein Scaly_0473400 [Sesamum calycinum]|uniref:Uncharacterized protein n=1 Tax=Sesamum calycinum TaxID=2727403 RepID=A0AAW2SFI5_9LAMI